MSEKKQFWLNVGLYVFFPIFGAVLGLLVFAKIDGMPVIIGQGMWLTWTTMLFGFFYFLAYVHFYDRDKLSTLFKVLGIIFAVVSIAICALLGLGALEDEGIMIAFGAGESFQYALVLAPLIWWLFARKFYRLLDENCWSETVNVILTVAYPVVCYLLAAVSIMIGALWGLLGLFAIVSVLWIYYEGSLEGASKFFTNLIYYVALMVAGILFATEYLPQDFKFNNLRTATICGWVGVFCSFFHFLGWDLWAEKKYDGERLDTNRFFVFIGALTTFVLGAICIFYLWMNAHLLSGITGNNQSDFANVFVNAVCFTPVVFFLFRCSLYVIGYQNSWSSLTEWTVTMVLPVLSYALAVIFLLIGFMIPFLVCVVAVLVLIIIMKKRESGISLRGFVSDHEPWGSGSSGSSSSSSGSKSGGAKLSTVASCVGLADDLKYGVDHNGYHIGGWWIDKPYDLKVQYWDHSHSIDVTVKVTCNKGSYVADHQVIGFLRPQIEKIIRRYQDKNPETKAVRFDINYNITFVER